MPVPRGDTKMKVCFVFLLLIAVTPPQDNSWRSVIPLHSTRAEVEKLLGPPRPESKGIDAATYQTPSEKVFVLYSTGPCRAKPNNGWNAPRGTVVELSVEPTVKSKLTELKLDESKYSKKRDPELPDYTYYRDDEDGIRITVNTAEGVVVSFSYGPTSKERSLRCSTASENVYDVTGFLPNKFAEYSNISRESESKYLDNFATLLRRFPSTQGYIIAYAGKSAPAGEAQRLANRSRNYLIKTRRVNSARLIRVDGGRREAWSVELYLVPPGVTSPVPSPTISTRMP